ncbi:MAG: hypothetical protein ACK5LJ_18080 [Paracoccus sp. (in: a-proteobacteria)]
MNIRKYGGDLLASIERELLALRSSSLLPASRVKTASRVPSGSDYSFSFSSTENIAEYVVTVTFEAGEGEAIARMQLAVDDGNGWVSEPYQLYSLARPLLIAWRPNGSTTTTSSWLCAVIRNPGPAVTIQNKFIIFSSREVASLSVSGLTKT